MSLSKELPLLPTPLRDRSTDWDENLPTLDGFYATLEAAWATIDTPLRHRLPAIFSVNRNLSNLALNLPYLNNLLVRWTPPSSRQKNTLWKIGTHLVDFRNNLEIILKSYTLSQLSQWQARAEEAMKSVLHTVSHLDSPWDCAGWVVAMGKTFALHIARIGCFSHSSRFTLKTIAHTIYGECFTPLSPHQEPLSSPAPSDTSSSFDDIRL
ncbi:hypothetical protein CspeluHIS016_0803560 [Cutaneotrichosporon spelunceum]|uniref:Uncharacterized protein n=1 Tax=Cutaneotrichosporon spelunceum TaxID=1672016 RepID=A0AAD3YDZ9_9TREE|nr:hypothetical protein CspeluHIS016_0803560 [Cutaneotrichosporon spelunceum]